MSNEPTELPIFPTAAPAVFCDPDSAPELFAEVLEGLAAVVTIDDSQINFATPCSGFVVGELRDHALGWLGFFADALSDPDATQPRRDPEAFALTANHDASIIVRQSLDTFRSAIADNVAGRLVTMSSSRMAGDGVLAMALGEYIIHAWDLARATGQAYSVPESAIAPALSFLQGMVAPEYRGPDSGFFDDEVSVPKDAPMLDRLLGFAGRDPEWTASS